MNSFTGADLAWYGKPTGLASIRPASGMLQLCNIPVVTWIRPAPARSGQLRPQYDQTALRTE
jgi:hypothetical protein